MKKTGQEAKAYQQLVQKHTPAPPIFRNAVMAFFVGGTICAIGQGVLLWFMGQGMRLEDAALPTAATMIGLGALLTGVGVYDEVVRHGGMGGALPITGFANAIVAPAMEAKREGYVLGVGARLFSIAGPVLIYGILVAVIAASLRFWLVGP